MNIRKVFKDIMKVSFSNLFSLLVGVLLTLLLPKILSKSDFGLYKTFTLYLSFFGIMHLGFNDGLLLRYKSTSFNNIDFKLFRRYFYHLVKLLILIALILSLLSIMIFNGEKSLIILLVILNAILLILNSYFGFISQFTQRFNIYTLVNFITRFFVMVLIFGGIYFISRSYMIAIFATIIANLVGLFINLYIYKFISFGAMRSKILAKEEIKKIHLTGIMIMLGNFTGIFILGIDRLFVDSLFSIEIFAEYSLSYSFMNIIFIFIASLTYVVFPLLSRLNKSYKKLFYIEFSSILLFLTSFTLPSIYLINIFVKFYLPDYYHSIVYLTILFPIIIFRFEFDIIKSNFLKSNSKIKLFIINNFFGLSISVALNTIAIIIFRTPESISYATVISFFIWFVYSEIYIGVKERVKINFIKIIYIIVMIILYYSFVNRIVLYISVLTFTNVIYYQLKIKANISKIKQARSQYEEDKANS